MPHCAVLEIIIDKASALQLTQAQDIKLTQAQDIKPHKPLGTKKLARFHPSNLCSGDL